MNIPVPSTLTEKIEIKWGTRQTIAELRRTQRRVLRIEVRPSADVVVFAPDCESVTEVKKRVERKCAWIFRKIDRVLDRPSITPERHFVSGETHLLLGRQYRLSIQKGDKPQVRVEGTRMNLLTERVDDQAHCRKVITEFYAATARDVFTERLNLVAPPFIRKGLHKPSLVVRKMSKRWGSYTPAGRIVLNVDLVRANPILIDYVISHELAHAFYSDHGKDWRNLLSMVMPDWENRKARLEAFLR